MAGKTRTRTGTRKRVVVVVESSIGSDDDSSSITQEEDKDANDVENGTRKKSRTNTKERAATMTKSKITKEEEEVEEDQQQQQQDQQQSVPLVENSVPPSENENSFDIMLPLTLGTSGGGECNVLIQVDPEDATHLDYNGVSGAIGRFEAGEQGIGLDLHGCQYHGSLLPGPTSLVVSLAKGHQLKVEGLTDEFATLTKTQDIMAKLDAIVTGAQLDDGYKVLDENVNAATKEKSNDNEKGKQTNSRKRPVKA